MKRALPLLLLAIAGCDRPPPRSPGPSIEDQLAARYLLIHWPNGGPDYVREYPNLQRCDNARREINQLASENVGFVDAENAARGHSTSPPLPTPPQPVAACLPE